ncbi:MAG: tetratricopeptide repeat protein [Spirochaetes bacterium]|nr:tetratricopeptide repeat protein [Spirochaetota bacterium]
MAEAEEITYTPEELAEIERIVTLIERSGHGIRGEKEAEAPAAAEKEEAPAVEEEYHPAPDQFEEPADLSLPSVDLDSLTGEPKRPEKPRVEEEAAPIEDITGLIHEVEEEAPPVAAEEYAAPPEEKAKPGGLSPVDELDFLTAEEPESLDRHERAPADAFVEETPAPKKAESPVFEDIDLADLGAPKDTEVKDLGFLEETGEAPAGKPSPGVTLEKEQPGEIPDLSDISFDEGKVEMAEAREADIPELDIPEAGSAKEAPSEAEFAEPEPTMEELTDDDLASIKSVEELGDVPQVKSSKDIISQVQQKKEVREAMPDLEADIPELPAVGEDQFEVEMLEEEPKPAKKEKPSRPAAESPAAEKGEKGIDLSDHDIMRLKKAILLFNPAIREAVKDVVINDLLPTKDTRQLINMILGGRPEGSIQKYLEEKLDKTIPLVEEKIGPARRVITARPEYAAGGRERQKKLLAITGIAGAAAIVTCALVVLGYQFLYKPMAAKRMIKQGAAYIRESGDYLKKPKDYARAEKLFREVDEDYVRDYSFGYTEYAQAYFDKREYAFSIEKLNKLYDIQRKKGQANDIDLLNKLGYFYSKVPKEYYNTMRLNINRWYYPESDKKREEWSQLDVAIEMYRRVLVRDRKNITALFGIGNAYFYQGQYFKAKKYYEDIVDLEPDSEIGYSGLLNLYIDRDVFERVIDMHAVLSEKKMMSNVQSSLLAKLAAYYLDKQKSKTSNVRIDYGVQSPRFKDSDDNIFPAVIGVLSALNKRDSDYPPLHLQYARLNKAQDNLKLMKIHLEKAIDLSRKNYDADYFGALHLLGEYYYLSKEPVKAYETLNRAIKAAEAPPEFTREDFYKETESTGKSYALLGNIFYYYFDKVRMRYGDLEDESIDQDDERMGNYQIAREKYEKAIDEGYESSEVHYNLGRIYYLNRLYQKALDQWLNLYEDFAENPEIMFALGNAFYHMGSYDAAKGEYLKLISAYEYELDKMKIARRDLPGHVKLVQFLSSTYNNLGAVYQGKNNESKSEISFWKSIDYAQLINSDNEFARVNLARSFRKEGGAGEPILDESIPYSMEYYRPEMRK